MTTSSTSSTSSGRARPDFTFGSGPLEPVLSDPVVAERFGDLFGATQGPADDAPSRDGNPIIPRNNHRGEGPVEPR